MTTKMVSIRLDEELVDYLQHQADREYRTLSGYIQSVLMKDKSLNGRPIVNVGDKIKCQDGIAAITDIDEFENWSIVWSDGKKDSVPTICQHNWKVALNETKAK